MPISLYSQIFCLNRKTVSSLLHQSLTLLSFFSSLASVPFESFFLNRLLSFLTDRFQGSVTNQFPKPHVRDDYSHATQPTFREWPANQQHLKLWTDFPLNFTHLEWLNKSVAVVALLCERRFDRFHQRWMYLLSVSNKFLWGTASDDVPTLFTSDVHLLLDELMTCPHNPATYKWVFE